MDTFKTPLTEPLSSKSSSKGSVTNENPWPTVKVSDIMFRIGYDQKNQSLVLYNLFH